MQKDEETSCLHAPAFSQPICSAVQIAIVDLFRHWNIFPSAVVGHSSGEIAAAYCVGGISRESAWKIAYFRGLVAAKLAVNTSREPESMMSVNLSETDVEAYLRQDQIGHLDGNVAIGCFNSPRNITLTGSEKRLNSLKALLEKDGILAQKLKVGVAYHSTTMNAVASDYHMLIGDIRIGEPLPRVPSMFSSVTGKVVDANELSDAEYWVRNLVLPVRFCDAITTLYQSSKTLAKRLGHHKGTVSIDHLIEIGPHSTLQRPIRDIAKSVAPGKETGYSSFLKRGACAIQTTLKVVGHLHCLGYALDLLAVNQLGNMSIHLKTLVDLPSYPFDHSQSYWLESRFSKDYRFRKSPKHEFLGTPVSDLNSLAPRWRNVIRLSENPWISHHKVCKIGCCLLIRADCI